MTRARLARMEDAAAIARIYNHGIEDGIATLPKTGCRESSRQRIVIGANRHLALKRLQGNRRRR